MLIPWNKANGLGEPGHSCGWIKCHHYHQEAWLMDTGRKTVTLLITRSGCQILPNSQRTHRDKRLLYAWESDLLPLPSCPCSPHLTVRTLCCSGLYPHRNQSPWDCSKDSGHTIPSDPRGGRKVSGSVSHPTPPSL